MLNLSLPNPESIGKIKIQKGDYPSYPSDQNLIKVCVGDAIGYAQTEEEAIQMIEKLRNW